MSAPQTQHCIIPTDLPTTTTPIHFLPCSIHYSGPVKLDRYFFPEAPKDYQENLSSTGELIEKPIPKTQHEQVQAVFRGHLIKGHKHQLPSGTIGVILQSNSQNSSQSLSNVTNDTSSQTTTTISTTNSTAPPTTLRRRGQKRSKQDLLFDEEDMNNGDDKSQVLLSQSQHILSQQPIESTISTTQSNHNMSDNNQTSITITHVFDSIHIWDPEVIEDHSLFEFRRQPIDEFIPLANALHSTCYNDDE